MRNIARVIAISLCIGITSGQQEVLGDKLDAAQRYENIWHSTVDWHGRYNKTETMEMTITITTTKDGQNISWEINKETLDHVDYEYLSSNLPMSIPFFCVYARDGENEHIFCGILYSERSWDDQIRGIYEITSPCPPIEGEPTEGRCVETLAIELQAEIDKYDGHK